MNTWRSFLQTIARNPISAFAVLCVAATAGFLGYMTHRFVDVLESYEWCGRAVQAERIVPSGKFEGLTSCNTLLEIQLKSLSTGLHISIGSFSLSLIVLIVVVIAGARASGKFGPEGVEFDVSREAASAAHETAEAAVDKATDIAEGKL